MTRTLSGSEDCTSSIRAIGVSTCNRKTSARRARVNFVVRSPPCNSGRAHGTRQIPPEPAPYGQPASA
jgi:hypothetical protein